MKSCTEGRAVCKLSGHIVRLPLPFGNFQYGFDSLWNLISDTTRRSLDGVTKSTGIDLFGKNGLLSKTMMKPTPPALYDMPPQDYPPTEPNYADFGHGPTHPPDILMQRDPQPLLRAAKRALTSQKWDDRLAVVAQKWANQCEAGHDKERNVPYCKGTVCYNGGKLDPDTCQCKCTKVYKGRTSKCPAQDAAHCKWWPKSHCRTYYNVPQECPRMCGIC
ncbi:unnamed protein product [Mytilus edulis]|uniref:SCP domain-containing protein n=1 Tax=Mytilus edulis TaxID=6550 RepID=A0A8S3U594_MYTED|nr:unnamed protein product [Mytilus edulis]